MLNLQEKLTELKQIEETESSLETNRLELTIRKGKLLLEIKDSVPHGTFQKTLKDNGCNTSFRTAQRQMSIASNEDLIRAKTTDLSQMTVEQALKLIKKESNKEKEANQVVEEVVQFSIKSDVIFNAHTQLYEITIHVPGDKASNLLTRSNEKKLIQRIKQQLKAIQEHPCILDISNLSQN
jgi:hypothetical protein